MPQLKPPRTSRATLIIRLSQLLHQRLKTEARAAGISLNHHCVRLLEGAPPPEPRSAVAGLSLPTEGMPQAQLLVEGLTGEFGEQLEGAVCFGSWARGVATPVSDIDLLVVAEPLPHGRIRRVSEFEAIESATETARRAIWPAQTQATPLSPVIKTPAEVRLGSPLFLDMTDRAVLLYDPARFLETYLRDLAERLRELGGKRHPRKGGYFWQYKGDIRPHEAIKL